MKILRKILSALPVALIVLVAVFSIYYAISVSNGGSASLFGYRSFRLVSGSMEPDYPVGSVVICKRVDTNTLKLGDVITFKSSDPNIFGKTNTHLIVDIEVIDGKTFFTTKGLAVDVADKYKVSSDDVYGKVVAKSDLLSLLISVFDRKWAYPVFIIMPLLLVTAYTAKQYMLVLKSHVEERKKDDIGT